MKNKTVAIILAAGAGLRFNSEGEKKQLVKLAGKPVLSHTINIFDKHPNIDEIIVVVEKGSLDEYKKIILNECFSKVVSVIRGGDTRQESSYKGILCCDKECVEKVLIHDAVRPFVSNRIISEIIEKLNDFVSVDVAIPSPDTLVEVDDKNIISNIPKRSSFLRGQTPQGFQLEIIKKAHELSISDNTNEFTDDCSLVLYHNLGDTYVIRGEEENIKITRPLDIHIADKIFQIKSISLKNQILKKEKLKNKNIIIFGHTSGIGKDIFNICSLSGANVFGYSLETGFDICESDKIEKIYCTFEKEKGKIDFLISTAGILLRNNLENFSLDEISKQINVNYTAQVNLVRNAIKFMGENSSIILFTSSSYTRGRESYSIYSSTKAAIVNFVQAVSEELFNKKISINAICPARTNTPMRRNNFGEEPPESLLDPNIVAEETLKVCLSGFTGQIINIRK